MKFSFGKNKRGKVLPVYFNEPELHNVA